MSSFLNCLHSQGVSWRRNLWQFYTSSVFLIKRYWKCYIHIHIYILFGICFTIGQRIQFKENESREKTFEQHLGHVWLVSWNWGPRWQFWLWPCTHWRCWPCVHNEVTSFGPSPLCSVACHFLFLVSFSFFLFSFCLSFGAACSLNSAVVIPHR